MKEIVDAETVNLFLEQLEAASKARIFQGNTQKPFGIQKLVIPLDTERLETDPYKLNFPFRCLYVKATTDSSVEINFKPNAQESFQSAVPMKLNDVFDNDFPVSSGIFYWDAQPGKSITLIFFLHSSFRSGSMISLTSGGVSISSGDSYVMGSTALTGGAAAQILAQDTARKNAIIQAPIGQDLWIGGVGVTPATGIRIPAGENRAWTNTAAAYGYLAANGNAVTMSES